MNEEIIKEKEHFKGKEITRYHLKTAKSQNSLGKAREWTQELQKMERPYQKDGKWYIKHWRIGITTPSNLVIDIDNHNENELKTIQENLKILFPKDDFVTLKTLNGYQIIDKAADKVSFQFKNLKVLNKDLNNNDPEKVISYREQLIELFDNGEDFNEDFSKSELFNPIGTFDYLYNCLGVMNGYYSLRLTKKSKNDNWEVIK